MPIYTFACELCKTEFEFEQKLADKPLEECFWCDGKVKKIIVPGTSFQLKGTGWFKDGYDKSNKES